MNEIIYLEPDDDITGVLMRIKKLQAKAVALVIPRGGTIGQSVINLKLLKRESEKNGVVIGLVTKDKISKNLADQIGIEVFAGVTEAKSAKIMTEAVVSAEKTAKNPENIGEIKVNRYNKEDEMEPLVEDELESDETEEEGEPEDEAENEAEDENLGANDYNRDREELRIKEEKGEVDRKINEPKTDSGAEKEEKKMNHRNLSSRRKPLLIILGVFLILGIIVSGVVLPSAQARVVLRVDDCEKKYDVVLTTATSGADLNKMELPSNELVTEKEESKEFSSTGSKNVGTKATGEITFYNDYDPSNSIKLSAGTILTASGKEFVLDAAITIPPATVISLYPPKTNPGTIKGQITAKEAGSEYNIGASTFLISGFSGVKMDKVYGSSTTALSGGTTEIVKFVSASDLSGAREELSEEISVALRKEVDSAVVDNSGRMIDSGYKEEEVSYVSTKQSLEEAERFSITIKKKATAYYFSETMLRESIIKKVEMDLGDTAMVVAGEKSEISYGMMSVADDGKIVNLSVLFKGKSGRKMAESEIKELLLGTKLGMAKSKIEAIEGVDSAEITVKPSFWPMIPFIDQKIIVIFSYYE